MNSRQASLVVGLTLSLLAGAAHAAPVTQTYDFDALFSNAPISEITGSFDVNYLSPTESVASNFTSSLPADFQPYQIQSYGNSQYIFDNPLPGGGCEVDGFTNQFCFVFTAALGSTPTSFEFVYSVASDGPQYFADSVTFSTATSTVPLPAAAPLFGAALLALGAAHRALKRTAQQPVG